MDIILHLGAHRTGSTSFQRYMRASEDRLANLGIGFWGPGRTRNGLFHDVPIRPRSPQIARRAAGRVRLACHATAQRGIAVLVISDENMIGTPRNMIAARTLYPQLGERMARFHHAFGGRIRRVSLQIRSLDTYWASLLAYALPRGNPLPDGDTLRLMAQAQRSWRAVITDLACALPGVEIVVTPFERFADRPDRLLAQMSRTPFLPAAQPGEYWFNRSPDLAALRGVLADRGENPDRLPRLPGRWQPFTAGQTGLLRETYSDDLYWLRAGADGLARYIEETEPDKTRLTWPPDPATRGHTHHDSHQRTLAQTR
ncbi:hypothetical protein [Puniceibacterium confluentis]|uniref:hypothetical protein n=1 Tax=Puniceibacterium confluentis TaxID=1958944 RepID=UPI0011B5C5C9|nr:hypothetical protein [Puniceibacterium confluentis]